MKTVEILKKWAGDIEIDIDSMLFVGCDFRLKLRMKEKSDIFLNQ